MRDRFARDAGDETGEAGARAVGQSQGLDRRFHRARGDVDDAAELARDHMVDGGLDHFDRCDHVHIQRGNPGIAVPVAKIPRRRAACVVDQDVRLRASREHRGATGLGCDVGGDRDDLDAGGGANFLSGFLERFLAPRGDDQVHAFARERERAGASQALARCAHQCGFAANSHIHLLSP